MILAVTGGRDYSDVRAFGEALDLVHVLRPFELLVHGCATGADTLAAEWAMSRGIHPVGVPALWDFYGKPAGGKRNRAMLLLKPDLVVAFPGGTGTANMRAATLAAGIPLWIYGIDILPGNQDLVS